MTTTSTTPDIHLADYAPKPQPDQRRPYLVGTDGVQVHSNGEVVLVTANPPPVFPQRRPVVLTRAVEDIYAEFDFRSFRTSTGARINPGVIVYTKWDLLNWVQDYVEVPETELEFDLGDDTIYLHLLVPFTTYVSTSAPAVTPFVARDGIGSLGTEYRYADTTEWQGVAGTPSYEVTQHETRTIQESIHSVMLASITSAGDLRIHHAGQVVLPQGYVSSNVFIT